jgi:hypothetical protein
MENVPIYVKVDKYKELTETLKAISAKIEAIDKTLEKVHQLKSQEDLQIQVWAENISDVKLRMEKINRAFYE